MVFIVLWILALGTAICLVIPEGRGRTSVEELHCVRAEFRQGYTLLVGRRCEGSNDEVCYIYEGTIACFLK